MSDILSEIVRFTFLLPIVHEEMPEQIFIKKMDDGLIFVAKIIDDDQKYKWNIIHDDLSDVRYKLYYTNMLMGNNNGDICLECYLPTYIVEKVGIHYSYSCDYLPFIPLICDFKTYQTRKSVHFFDHNVIDFTPKIEIKNKEKLKIFIYRPTFYFKDNKREINCICFIEY